MRISNEWKNYECIDAGNGEKLERWGRNCFKKAGTFSNVAD